MIGDVIREFLIGIAWAIDEESKRRAQAAIRDVEGASTGADKRTVASERAAQRERDKLRREEEVSRQRAARSADQFGKQIGHFVARAAVITAAASAGVVAAVHRISEGLEEVAYQSQRTGTSVAGLKAFAYAAQSLGVSAGTALGSVENLAERLRENPRGFAQFLRQFGVEALDAQGKVKGAVQVMNELRESAKFMALPYATRKASLDVLGIDPRGFEAMDPAARARKEAEIAEKNRRAAYDPDAAAQDAHKFEEAWRSMWASIEIIGSKAISNISRQLGGQIGDLTTWLDQNGSRIAQNLTTVAKLFLDLADALLKLLASDGAAKFLASLRDGLASMVKAFDEGGEGGAAGKVDALTKALIALGALLAGQLILGPLGTLAKLLAAVGAFNPPAWFLAAIGLAGAAQASTALGKGGLSAGVDPLTADAPTDVVGGSLVEPGGGRGALAPFRQSRIGRAVGRFIPKILGGRGGDDAPSIRRGYKPGKAQLSANALAVMDEFKKAGLPDEAVAALMGSSQTESGFNPRARNEIGGGHTGLIQWDKNRWPKVKAWIESQGGDPYDARWQARAAVAEGRAKPGDAIYDSRQTQRGFSDLENSKGDFDRAKRGIQQIERYGPGEEGGRYGNADAWLPKVRDGVDAKPNLPPGTTQGDRMWDGQRWYKRGPNGMVPEKPYAEPSLLTPEFAARAAEIVQRAQGAFGGINMGAIQNQVNTVPVGGWGNQTSNDNSRKIEINAPTTITSHSSGDAREAAEAVAGSQRRVHADLLRNLTGAIG